MLHRQFLLRFALVSASAAASLALAHPAFAQFVINEPTVENGELEFETHGSFQSGFPDEDEKNAKETDEEEAPGADEEEEPFTRHGHEIEMGYGFTDFWKLELGLGLQQPHRPCATPPLSRLITRPGPGGIDETRQHPCRIFGLRDESPVAAQLHRNWAIGAFLALVSDRP